MATYKVLQDIEAEDKLVGPLTLRQFIYAIIAAVGVWMAYLFFRSPVPFMAVIFLPFIGFGVFFAFPWNKQQSTEVWALAKVRFMLKPRKRIWDQRGIKHLVTVTVPKMLKDPRQHNMSQTEARTRLRALAATVDSRGWAVKNVPLDMYTQPTGAPISDRLVAGSSIPTQMVNFKELSSDDIFDLDNNPVAQQFNAKISAAEQTHRQQILTQMTAPAQAPSQAQAPVAQTQQQAAQNYWYAQPTAAQPAGMPQAVYQQAQPVQNPVTSPAATQSYPSMPVAATPTPQEEAFAQELRRQQQLQQVQPNYSHLKVVQPLSSAPQAPLNQPQSPVGQAVVPTAPAQPAPPVTPPVNPAILELANNNDLNVATIAREAHHRSADGSDEVVVSLH